MRRFLSVLLLLVMLSPLTLRADEKIVGTIGDLTTAVVPFRNTSEASYTQSIYPQSEVGGATTITAVAFGCATPTQTTSADVKIYIGETTKTTHANSSDWETLALVYEGTGVTLGGEDWENFTFTTPYEYSGTKNLVIAVSSTNTTNMNLKWYYVSETGTKPSMHNTGASAEPSGTASVKGYRPVIKLTMTGESGSEENPTLGVPEVTAVSLSSSEIKLSWNEVGGATSYNVYQGTEAIATNLTETTYTVTALTAGTNYCFSVTAENEEAGESDASTQACATTTAEGEEPEQPSENEDLLIGNGTINVFSAPIYNYGSPSYVNYSVSQQIFTQEEIGAGGGNITSISFHQATGNNNVRDIVVYLKNTDKTSYSDASDWVNMSEADVVYSGEFTFGTANEWVKIEFPAPFEYTGSNLLVTVCDNTGTNVGYSQTNADKFYSSQVTALRGLYKNGKANAVDCSNLTEISGSEMMTGQWDTPQYAYFVNNIKLDMEKSEANVETPEIVNFGKVLLDEYWTEKTSVKFNVKAVNTTITNVTVDNDFFVLPAEIDYAANPLTIELSYDRNAEVNGAVNGTLTITYTEGTKEVPVTATVYVPVTPDVAELAKEVVFAENAYTDTPVFTDLNDNYLLPREVEDGNAPDAVYAFELTEDALVSVSVTGTNANFAIYNEDFDGVGGPSTDNSLNGVSFNPKNFFFDFNDGTTDGWTLIDEDGDGYNWEVVTEGDYVYVRSYSYLEEKDENADEQEEPNVLVSSANNILMTENVYNITPNSKLSFDAFCYGHAFEAWKDHVIVEVSKDGETFVSVKKILPAATEFSNVVVDLGAEFATLNLEYGDYHVALRHQETDRMYVCLDNIRLVNDNVTRATEKVSEDMYYTAGRYYLVAAAEDAFTVNISAETAPLAPPTEIFATVTETSVTLTWNEVTKAESYNIYRGENLIANVTDMTYTEENLTPYTEYCYVVKSVAGEEESFATEEVCVMTLDLPVATPVNVKAEALSQSSIKLTWDAVENATYYNIYASELVATVTEPTYTIVNLQTYTNYCYSVTSARNDSESEKSEVVCAKTLDLAVAAPTNVVATPLDESTIVLTWQMGENANSYNIYRDGDMVAEAVTGLLYSDKDLKAGTTYCYVLKGVRNGVESEASEEVCATTEESELPATPENLDATAETSSLTIYLTWDAVANASSYNVYMNDEKIANVTATTLTVSEGLKENTEYCFTVTTVVGELESLHSEEVCATTATDGIEENEVGFNIYPNPVSDKLVIETEVNVEKVSVYNVNGQQTTVNGQQTSSTGMVIDVTNLNAGVYFVKVVTDNGEVVKRFVKK